MSRASAGYCSLYYKIPIHEDTTHLKEIRRPTAAGMPQQRQMLWSGRPKHLKEQVLELGGGRLLSFGVQDSGWLFFGGCPYTEGCIDNLIFGAMQEVPNSEQLPVVGLHFGVLRLRVESYSYVDIWHILRTQMGSHLPTLRPRYIL